MKKFSIFKGSIIATVESDNQLPGKIQSRNRTYSAYTAYIWREQRILGDGSKKANILQQVLEKFLRGDGSHGDFWKLHGLPRYCQVACQEMHK